ETADNATAVTFAKTAGAGTVTGLATPTAAGGIATFTATGDTAGPITITASRAGLTSDSSAFTVTTGPADHLFITSSNGDLVAGGAPDAGRPPFDDCAVRRRRRDRQRDDGRLGSRHLHGLRRRRRGSRLQRRRRGHADQPDRRRHLHSRLAGEARVRPAADERRGRSDDRPVRQRAGARRA